MTTQQTLRRRRGRLVRANRRRGYSKKWTSPELDRFQRAWDLIRGAAAPAIRYTLDLIAAEEASPRPHLIHNGRKPR